MKKSNHVFVSPPWFCEECKCFHIQTIDDVGEMDNINEEDAETVFDIYKDLAYNSRLYTNNQLN